MELEKNTNERLKAFQRECGTEHEGLVEVHLKLANLAAKQRHNAAAERNYRRAIQLTEKHYSVRSARLIEPLRALADFHADIGRLDLAVGDLERACRIAIVEPGLLDPHMFALIFDLLQTYTKLKQDAKVIEWYMRAAMEVITLNPAKIRSKAVMPEMEVMMGQIIERAFFVVWMHRRFDLAGKLVRDLETAPNAKLAEVATVYKRIRELHARVSPETRALLAEKTKAAAGKDDVEARLLFEAAQNVLRRGEKDQAIHLLIEGMYVAERHLQKQRSMVVVNAWLNELRAPMQLVLSLLPEQGQVPATLSELVWTALLSFHARSLDKETQAFKRLRGQTGLRRLREENRSFREFAAGRGSSATFVEAYRQHNQMLDNRLLGAREEFLESTAESFEAADVLLRNLTRLSVLVHFIEWSPPTLLAMAPAPARYLALLLLPDGKTFVVPIGPSREIEDSISKFLLDIRDPASEPTASAKVVHDKLLLPILKAAPAARTLEIVTDGAINLIPFDALFDGQNYVLDTALTIHYLMTSRDLIPPRDWLEISGTSGRQALVLADPDFHKAPTSAVSSRIKSANPQAENLYAQMKLLDRLDGARAEATKVAPLLATEAMLDEHATEELLRSRERPGILVLATHGVFLDDTTPGPGDRGPSLLAVSAPALSLLGQRMAAEPGLLGKRIEHPMLRSALALAGAAQAERARDTKQDGILTADEVRELNLEGTKLVVLSACETARGSVRAGDGVYGLRRAFLVAGAESLIASLWRVSDRETGKLMTAYFKVLVNDHQPRLTALRQVMSDVRERLPHPYYWAPFIGIGRDERIELPKPAAAATSH